MSIRLLLRLNALFLALVLGGLFAALMLGNGAIASSMASARDSLVDVGWEGLSVKADFGKGAEVMYASYLEGDDKRMPEAEQLLDGGLARLERMAARPAVSPELAAVLTEIRQAAAQVKTEGRALMRAALDQDYAQAGLVCQRFRAATARLDERLRSWKRRPWTPPPAPSPPSRRPWA